MEMFRAEYLARQPKNWGKIIYDKLEASSIKDKTNTRKSVPSASSNVRLAMEENLSMTGPLNGGKIVQTCSDDEQVEIFSQYNKCKVLLLNDWTHIPEFVLRCISLTMGESLIDLDLSGSCITAPQLEMLLANTVKLKRINVSNCPYVDGACMNLLAKLAGSTCIDLKAMQCPQFKTDPILWLSGAIGSNTPKLSKLKALDLSECPLQDDGLIAVSTCCKLLRYLNLSNCSDVTDKSLVNVIAASKHLELLNVNCCSMLTNRTALAIAANCHKIQSINFARCHLITDVGINAITRKCPRLQSLNLAGLLKVSENALYNMTRYCPNILMLNVTGCESITTDGLKALVQGLEYVEMGLTFIGFKPIDAHVEQKLTDHLNCVHDLAIKHITHMQSEKKRKEDIQQQYLNDRRCHACDTIKQYMGRYLKRLYFYHKWRKRVSLSSVCLVQRVYRGYRGRLLANVRNIERDIFYSRSPTAILMQKVVRGHLCRLNGEKVFKAIRLMYQRRVYEAEAAISVRFQAKARRYLAKERVKAWREVCTRRYIDTDNAIYVLQQLARTFLAKLKVTKIRYNKRRLAAIHHRAATVIGMWYRKRMAAYISTLKGKDMQKIMRKTWTASMLLQRVVRGYLGRERVYNIRITHAHQYAAAVIIQKCFRCARVMYWRDLRLNIIAAFVLDRQYIERKDRIRDARLRYSAFVDENRRDSASDEEDISHDVVVWDKHWDKARKIFYWTNKVDKEVSFVEPKGVLVEEKALLDQRVKVYWVINRDWYQGTVTQYNRKKDRHRIDYDDGDHEWLNFSVEAERIQIQLDDGSWTMYALYHPPVKIDEWNKVDEKKRLMEVKKQSWRDANQWSIASNDVQPSAGCMYISSITGELRAGTKDSSSWVVQDDGYGFPSFYNIYTTAVEFEDPRFIHNSDADMEAQRIYVMTELRYALYFCKDYWEHYSNALQLGDPRQVMLEENKIRKSQKPKILASFCIRAKALYRQASVVDRDVNKDINEELVYATWMSSRMAEIIASGERNATERRLKKATLIQKLSANNDVKLDCRKCGRETQKHLDYCPHCGMKQGVMYMYVLDKVKNSSSSTANTVSESTSSPTTDVKRKKRDAKRGLPTVTEK